jgi:hypothetical protein
MIHEAIYTTDDGVCAVVWAPPEAWALSEEQIGMMAEPFAEASGDNGDLLGIAPSSREGASRIPGRFSGAVHTPTKCQEAQMHRNALLTPEGRLRLCALIEEGWTVAAGAESFWISRQTARKW